MRRCRISSLSNDGSFPPTDPRREAVILRSEEQVVCENRTCNVDVRLIRGSESLQHLRQMTCLEDLLE